MVRGRPSSSLLAFWLLLHTSLPDWCPAKLCQETHHPHWSSWVWLWSDGRQRIQARSRGWWVAAVEWVGLYLDTEQKHHLLAQFSQLLRRQNEQESKDKKKKMGMTWIWIKSICPLHCFSFTQLCNSEVISKKICWLGSNHQINNTWDNQPQSFYGLLF